MKKKMEKNIKTKTKLTQKKITKTVIIFINIIILYFYNKIKAKKNNLYYYNSGEEQNIKLLIPDKRCPKGHPRTVYFYNKFTNKLKVENWLNENNRKIDDVKLTDKKYFLSYVIRNNEMFSNSIHIILGENNFFRAFFRDIYKNNIIFSYSFHRSPNKNIINSPYIKFNSFPKNKEITYKDLLYNNFIIFQKNFPNDYNFIMETFQYPSQKSEIEKKFMNYNISKDNLWLIKPKRGSQGKGVHIFKSLELERGKSFLLTKYLSEPHLINGTKYDLRVYVLVTSFIPLKIYLYKEGLVRLATEKYSLDLNNTNNSFIHLTNVAVNKNNKIKYKPSEDSSSTNYNKWKFETYRKYLLKNYPERPNLYEGIRKKIADIVIKSIICGEEKIIESIKSNSYNSNFFQIFGYDIILDKNFNPFVLEINRKPQLKLSDKVDEIVKLNLLSDTLNIVGIIPFNKEKTSEPYDKNYNKKIKKNKEERAVDDSLCEFYRPMGDYERIFPLQENIEKYKKFFLQESKSYNNLLWKRMKDPVNIND